MNPVSVNPMAVNTWPLPQQIEMLQTASVDEFGLTVGACRDAGWETVRELLNGGDPVLGYLCHAVVARADDAESWRAETALLREAVDFAARVGAEQIYFTTGRQGDLTWEQAAERVAEHVTPLVDYARKAAVRISIENTLSLRSDISFTHSVRDAAVLAAMSGAQLCVDLYCCWGEGGLEETLRENLDRISMVQVSDMRVGDLRQPNRRVPGDGDIPLRPLLELLTRLGYQGLIDIELIGPEIERQGAVRALSRAVEWLTAMNERECE